MVKLVDKHSVDTNDTDGSKSDEAKTEPEFDSHDNLPLIDWTAQFNMAENFTENR